MLLEFQEAGPLFRDDGPPGVLILQLKDGVFRTISGRWQPAFVTNEEGLTKVGRLLSDILRLFQGRRYLGGLYWATRVGS